ncbi:unnamed protein product [Symbiodinium natans]|uniref:Uncharacterized protein n=1 Tax=Symbiodinium natans TaxID=878477 RepID=A0A812R3U3_9DINO|nr:unnamed protein product [Symbiodinium natans]
MIKDVVRHRTEAHFQCTSGQGDISKDVQHAWAYLAKLGSVPHSGLQFLYLVDLPARFLRAQRDRDNAEVAGAIVEARVRLAVSVRRTCFVCNAKALGRAQGLKGADASSVHSGM